MHLRVIQTLFEMYFVRNKSEENEMENLRQKINEIENIFQQQFQTLSHSCLPQLSNEFTSLAFYFL